MKLSLIIRQIIRTPYQSASAILIMTITFFVMSLFLILGIIAQGTLLYFESKPQLLAVFPVGTDTEPILQVKQELERTGKTKSVEFISSEKAVEIVKGSAQNEDFATDAEFINASVLPPSLEIKARSLSDLRELRTIVSSKEGVRIKYLEDVVDKLSSWLSGIRTGGAVLLILLSIESVLVVWTIIGLRVSQRKSEIEILNLLGATRKFIVRPFHIEGIIYGFTGATIGVLLMIGIIFAFVPHVQEFFAGEDITALSAQNALSLIPAALTKEWSNNLDGIPLYPMTYDFIALIVFITIVFGSVLGFLGSLIATTRYRLEMV